MAHCRSTPPGTRMMHSCTSTPRSPTPPRPAPTGNGAPPTPWATTNMSAPSPRSSPSTWKKPSPRFGLEWIAHDGHGFEIERHQRADDAPVLLPPRIDHRRLPACRAIEQRYGRKPSQRELAHLAQAANFKTRNAKHGTLDTAGARRAGPEARADARRGPARSRHRCGTGDRPRRRLTRGATDAAQRARAVPRSAEVVALASK